MMNLYRNTYKMDKNRKHLTNIIAIFASVKTNAYEKIRI
jgi:hypothetical protein